MACDGESTVTAACAAAITCDIQGKLQSEKGDVPLTICLLLFR